MPIEPGSFSLGAVIGGVIVGLANHFLSKSRNRESRQIENFNNAATQFRNAFLPEIVYLKRNAVLPGHEISSSNLRDILNSAYVHRHLAALETFLTYVSGADRSSIDKAWQEYCQNSQGKLDFDQYSCLLGGMGGEKAESLRQLALNRIEAILKFADPK